MRTFVRLVHELEEFVNDCLEELPVRFEEAGILADDVHDVGCDYGLVVLTALNLAKTKQVLNHSDQESLLGLLI